LPALPADGLSVAANTRALGTQEQAELARELARRRNRPLSAVLARLEERAQAPLLRSAVGTDDLGVAALVSDLGGRCGPWRCHWSPTRLGGG
jgi:hypothetical protein